MPPITRPVDVRPRFIVRRFSRADAPEPRRIELLLEGASIPLVFRHGRGLVRIAATPLPDGVWLEAVALTPMALASCVVPALARVVDEAGVPCELPPGLARGALRHHAMLWTGTPTLRVVPARWTAQGEAAEIHERGEGWVLWSDRLKCVATAPLQARLVPVVLRDTTESLKARLVDRFGGWKHRRWAVTYNADATLAVAKFCAELDLVPSRARVKTDRPRRRLPWGFGRSRDRAELGLDGYHTGGIGDHPRRFRRAGSVGRAGSVAVSSPYAEALRGMFDDVAACAAFEARLLRLGLTMRVTANGFYNEGCPTLMIFRADDTGLLKRIASTAGYLAPVT